MVRLISEEAVDAELYQATVARLEEMARLQNQIQKRRSVLIHGNEAVGKTRLVRKFLADIPLGLCVPQVQSRRGVLLSIAAELQRTGEDVLGGNDPKKFTTASLKGLVQKALECKPYILCLDHVSGPSKIVCGLIKDLNYFERTPVILVSRSPHMEDIGTLGPLCAGRADRIEIEEFPIAIALRFAREQASDTHLNAANLEEFLTGIVGWSNGNPGSILQMIQMARGRRYRIEDQLKSHVIYLDFRMGRTQEP